MKKKCFLTTSLLVLAAGCTTAPQPKAKPEMVHTIEKAEVLTEMEAINVAKSAIKDKTNLIISKNTTFVTGACFKIDFAIPKFARKGDRIWLVYKRDLDSNKIAYPILVNAETGNTHFLILNNICSKLQEKKK